MTTNPGESTFPPKTVQALLAEDALPADVRQELASASTYEEQCLALHRSTGRLPKPLIDSINAKDPSVLSLGAIAANTYLTDRGLIPGAN